MTTTVPRLVDLWKFQRDYLRDSSRFVVAMWARGCGKSAITAIKIVLSTLRNERKGKPSDWLIVSASADQAREALRLVEDFARVVYALAAHEGIIEQEVEFRTPEGMERYTRYELRLGNNTRIMALSASPRAIRGYTANIWWDESCFFDEDHAMWQALQHCTRGRLKIIVTSTPVGGSEKRFHQIIHDETIVRGKPLWSKHITDIYQACEQGRGLIYDLEMEKAAAEADAWATEMELQWIDPAATWFETPLLISCEDTRASANGSGEYLGGKCYIGNDIGLRGDRWVAWVLEEVSGTFVTREVSVLDRARQRDFDEHDKEIARLFKKYRVMRMCIDQGGMGERSTQEYQKIYGATRVEGVIFNVENKGGMAVLTKELMQEGRLLLPPNATAPLIRPDFRRLEKTVSAAGAVRFNAVRDKGGHADICTAGMLACNAAVTPVIEVDVKTSGESAQEQNIMTGWTTGLEGIRSGR